MKTKTEHMEAKCLNNDTLAYPYRLVVGKEYHVVRVQVYKRFATNCFYILENGMAYPSDCFTSTYLSHRDIGNDFK